MKLAVPIATVFLTLLGGCVDPAQYGELPQPLAEADDPAGAYEIIPDGQRPVPPTVPDEAIEARPTPTKATGNQLRVEVVTLDDPRCEGSACIYPGVCGHTVLTQGFPAVSRDGSAWTWVGAMVPNLDLVIESDTGDDHLVRLTEALDESADPEATPDCATSPEVRRLRREVREANAALAAHRWRPLEVVDVAIETSLEEPLMYEEVEARRRPVEARLRNRSFVVRVRKIAVLHHEPWDTGHYTALTGLYVDRESGLTLASYVEENEVCGLGPLQGWGMHRVHVPPDALAEADRRAPNLDVPLLEPA